MYIKKMENITYNDFIDICWKNWIYNSDYINQAYNILKQNKTFIEANFDTLKSIWIINWIGPAYLSKKIIRFITKIFDWVKYEWHDIFYFLWWTENDRIKADIWLLKYSLISLNNKIDYLNNIKLNILIKIFFIIFKLIIRLYYNLIIYFSFFMVRIFWNKAFLYKT